MTYENFHDLASGLQAVVTSLALVIGGYWTYWKFIRHGEGRAHVSFSAGILFLKRQGDWWIVELIVWIENKGKVRHRIKDFGFDLAILKNDDPVEEAKEYRNQVHFPHEIMQGSWIPEDWPYTFVDPGVRAPYSFLTRIPADASLVLLHAWFNYMDQEGNFHRAEKTATVPPMFPDMVPFVGSGLPPAFLAPRQSDV